MICGNFTTTDHGFSGEIRFFGKREQVVLLPIEGQDNEKAPHFRIVAADDPVLSPIAHDIADIDHAELFDFSIDLLIAGLEARTTPRAAER